MKQRDVAFATAVIVIGLVAPGGAATVAPPKTGLSRPTAASPSTGSQPTQKVTAPAIPGLPTPGSKITYVGPTSNITAVANAIQVNAKSLTTVVTVAPGLALTKPVTISIGYLSPWPTANNRLTQNYAPSVGNRFLYNDPEGDGRPRKLHLDITLSEPNPAGGVYSYNVPADLVLDPLYDVAISPLVFTLVQGCSTVGPDQIYVFWWNPDTLTKEGFRYFQFTARENQTTSVGRFAWSRAEVSASANLHKPNVRYSSLSILPPQAEINPIPLRSPEPLVPGKTQSSYPGLVSADNDSGCTATLKYTTTYQLRLYPNLSTDPNVRDHR